MSQTIDIVFPSDQTEGTTSTIGKWFKAVGDPVTANEPLLEITTDKVTVEVAAPADGVLAEILKQEGDAVEPGERLGRIRPGSAAAPAAELSPAVRRLLQEHRLDPGRITGSGRGGRITVQDVEALVGGAADRRTGGPAPAGPIPSRMVPHPAMRRRIAQHMVQSVAAAPHVTSVFQADLGAVLAHRAAHQPEFAARGVGLTLTAYFVSASIAGLRAVPEVNSRWRDDALEIFEDLNIGVATALPSGGLIVPVIPRAQDLDLIGIAQRLQDLTTRARASALEPGDVQFGTFTISNHGVSGSLLAAPIVIHQPQSAILGVGKLEKRAVVVERGGRDEVVVKPMVYVTLTIDHRVLDGFQANAFLSKWVEAIEGWT